MSLIEKIKNYSAKKLIAPALILGASMLGYSQLQSNRLDKSPLQTLMTNGDMNGDGITDIIHTLFWPKEGAVRINIYTQNKETRNEFGNRMYRKPRDDPIIIENLNEDDQIFVLTGNFNIDDDMRDYKCSYDDLLFGIYSPSKNRLRLNNFQQNPQAKNEFGNRMYRKPRDDPIIIENLAPNIKLGITVGDFNGDGRDDIEVKTFNLDTKEEWMQIYQQYVQNKNDKFSNRMYRKPRDDPIIIKYKENYERTY